MDFYKIFVLTTTLLITNYSHSDGCSSTECVGLIENIYIQANGEIYIGTPHDEKLANCSPVSGALLTLDTNDNNAKEIYSTLLAAYMADKKVKIRITESSPNCKIQYVDLHKGNM